MYIQRITFAICCFLVVMNACQNNEKEYPVFDTSTYVETVHQLNDIVLGNNFSPVVASRNYVYANVSAYTVLSSLFPEKYISLEGQLSEFPSIPNATPIEKKEVDFSVSTNLTFILVGNAVTFPEGSFMKRYDEIIQLCKQKGLSSSRIEASENYAKKIFALIMGWSKKDHYAQTRSATKYTVTNEEGRWVPTPTMYTSALEPHWNEIRPLVLDSASQFKPTPPHKYDIKNKKSPYLKELLEVKRTVETLTDEQKHIADFWDDNPFALHVEGHVMIGRKKYSPPGHWTNIIGVLCLQEQQPLENTIAIYTHCCIALFDANISTWDEKYRSNRIRPETVINSFFDPTWRPYLQTPPFPAYTSGHSVMSSAIAEVLHFYFPNIPYTDSTQRPVGIKDRHFQSVKQAALEASISRLYGGIHYRSDLEMGNIQGQQVGQLVIKKVKLLKPNGK